MIAYLLHTSLSEPLHVDRHYMSRIACDTIARTAQEVAARCRPSDPAATWIVIPERGWPIFKTQLTRGIQS
jgi:hypothetical protein